MDKTTCCFAGYRPEKLPWRFREESSQCIELKEILYRQMERLIVQNGVSHFISGMARGVDTYGAEIVLRLKRIYPVTLECALPYEGQAANWPERDRERYFSVIAQSDRETLLQRRYTWDCHQKRNRYMIDQSGYLFAVWNGNDAGTANTLRYAREQGRHILVIDPARLNREIDQIKPQ